MPGGGVARPTTPLPAPPPGVAYPHDTGQPHPVPSDRTTPLLVYILHLAAFVFAPLALAALVVAYLNRGRGDAIADGHYTFAIRTFWLGLLVLAVIWVATLILVVATGVRVGPWDVSGAGPFSGPLVLAVLAALAQAAWWVARCVRGLILLHRDQPVPDPLTWLW